MQYGLFLIRFNISILASYKIYGVGPVNEGIERCRWETRKETGSLSKFHALAIIRERLYSKNHIFIVHSFTIPGKYPRLFERLEHPFWNPSLFESRWRHIQQGNKPGQMTLTFPLWWRKAVSSLRRIPPVRWQYWLQPRLFLRWKVQERLLHLQIMTSKAASAVPRFYLDRSRTNGNYSGKKTIMELGSFLPS